MENITSRNAAYALMDGIDTFDKLFDSRKQLNDTIIKIQVNLMSARQNKANCINNDAIIWCHRGRNFYHS